jgi:hypothetical protein
MGDSPPPQIQLAGAWRDWPSSDPPVVTRTLAPPRDKKQNLTATKPTRYYKVRNSHHATQSMTDFVKTAFHVKSWHTLMTIGMLFLHYFWTQLNGYAFKANCDRVYRPTASDTIVIELPRLRRAII